MTSYAEITSEYAIRGTYCDLAVKLDGSLAFSIEVKAIGLDLKESYVKQAIDYAANQGVEWVGLTNGNTWRVYKIIFGKPISNELVVEFDLSELSHRTRADIELIGLLAKEGWQKAHLGDYHSQRQPLSRFTLGALLLSETVLDKLRCELRRISPEVKIETSEIKAALESEVLKREVIQGDLAVVARKKVSRSSGRPRRASKPKKNIVEKPKSPSTGPGESNVVP